MLETSIELRLRRLAIIPKRSQIEPNRERLSSEQFAARRKFWSYCQRAIGAARARAKILNVPFAITAGHIDNLFIDQDWRCAVSGAALEPPGGPHKPFQPSLDRIVPAHGYVPDNIRITCLMVNYAMNRWGEDALLRLLEAMKYKDA